MSDNNQVESYAAKLNVTGIALLVSGILGIILDIVSIVLWRSVGLIVNNAPGIYIGILAVVTGSLNMSSSRNANSYNVAAGLIFGILLCIGSAYMTYWEITAVLLAQTIGISGPTATHALTVVDGIGIFISACLSSFYSQQGRTAGLGS